MIYTIGLESNYFNGLRQVRSRPDGRLKTFAEETGGGYFELKSSDDLGPTFTRVAQELHSQYVLGFTPSVRDGKLHTPDGEPVSFEFLLYQPAFERIVLPYARNLKTLGIDKQVHLFDSFEGLPEPDATHDKGYKKGVFKSEYDELVIGLASVLGLDKLDT